MNIFNHSCIFFFCHQYLRFTVCRISLYRTRAISRRAILSRYYSRDIICLPPLRFIFTMVSRFFYHDEKYWVVGYRLWMNTAMHNHITVLRNLEMLFIRFFNFFWLCNCRIRKKILFTWICRAISPITFRYAISHTYWAVNLRNLLKQCASIPVLSPRLRRVYKLKRRHRHPTDTRLYRGGHVRRASRSNVVTLRDTSYWIKMQNVI